MVVMRLSLLNEVHCSPLITYMPVCFCEYICQIHDFHGLLNCLKYVYEFIIYVYFFRMAV